MDINQYEIQDIYEQLDENNKRMVEQLKKYYPVEFRLWKDAHYSSLVKRNDVPEPTIVVLYYTPLSQEKIAHELLHMFCAINLGINESMLSKSDEEGLCKYIFPESFCEQFLNNVEHILIYPEYKDMGYDPCLFFEPYDNPENKVNEFLKYGIKVNGKYSLARVVNYLALCIFLESFPLDNSCKKLIKKIKYVEYPLYFIVANFFKEIKDTDVFSNNYDYMQQQYEVFRDAVILWCNERESQLIYDMSNTKP